MSQVNYVEDLQGLALLAAASAREWGPMTAATVKAWGYDPLEASLRHQRKLISDVWRQRAQEGT